MQLKHLFGLLLASTLAFGRPAAAAQDPAGFELRIEGHIEIGPDGRVTEYTIEEDRVSEPVESLVAAAVRRWRFEPIIEDGRAVTGITDMRLELTAVPFGEDYRLRVDSVAFGPTSDAMVPPRYPARLVREGVGGKVVLIAQVATDGSVERVHVERVDLSREGRGGEAARWRAALGEAAAEAAKQWSFAGIEVIDGEPRGSSVRVPITFSLDDGWVELHRGESVPAPWLERPQVAAAAGESAGLAPESLDSSFRLKTDVVGTML